MIPVDRVCVHVKGNVYSARMLPEIDNACHRNEFGSIIGQCTIRKAFSANYGRIWQRDEMVAGPMLHHASARQVNTIHYIYNILIRIHTTNSPQMRDWSTKEIFRDYKFGRRQTEILKPHAIHSSPHPFLDLPGFSLNFGAHNFAQFLFSSTEII